MNDENKGSQQQARTVTAFLILRKGNRVLKRIKLFSDDLIVTIGRHENNTIRLTDDKNMISRSHAAILRIVTEKDATAQNSEQRVKEPQFLIRDLCSGLGTIVNNGLVRKKFLDEGDLIRIHDYTLAFTRKDLSKKPLGRTVDQDDDFSSSNPEAPTELGSNATRKDAKFTNQQKEFISNFSDRGMGVDPTESAKEFIEMLISAMPARRSLIGSYDGEVIQIKYHKGYEREDPSDIGREFLDKLKKDGFAIKKTQIWAQLPKDHFLELKREKPPVFSDQELDFLKEIVRLLNIFDSKREELIKRTPWPASVIGLHKEIEKCIEIASDPEIKNRDVLLLGETGTGKEVMARFIHEQCSKTRGEPFIPVNLSSLPEGMIYSQLFGHVKGSFTDAKETKEGYFKIAKGGTLFLDEVADFPMKVQVALLSSMQNRTIMKLGGSEPEDFKCRIIAATNRDIEKRIKADEFRSDLLARFTYVIQLPPLRKRIGELPLLVSYYIDLFSARALGVSREAMELLRDYEWPENVREVGNVVIEAIGKSNENIFSWDLPGKIRFRKKVQETMENEDKKLKSLEEGIKQIIQEALLATGGKIKPALAILKIPKSTLYKMMKDMGIPVGYGRKT
jgi:DNA-binding NtrC family response regulator/pSer/pThr/pTyr-binding forkhead associated (FHA) protein